MKNLILFFLLITGQIVFAQTGNLTKVPGTKCSLVPPAGFTAATTFSGFEDSETGASIMINEIAAPSVSIIDGFTVDALKGRGMSLISKQVINFNGSKATMVNLAQPANGMTYIKQVLIFGDSKNTVLVNGIYPEASKKNRRNH